MTTCGTHELNRGECLDLLGQSSLGRLAFVDSVGILPIIVPVNYVMHEGSVVFRAGPGAKLAAAVRGAAVAFEVGRTDETDQTGWTVLVRGIAEELVDAPVLTELREQHLRPWAPGTKRHYVRIDAHLVTGRRIDRNDAASPMWDPTM
ncbi:hypothetical protein GCM10022204_44000 [Microlunatus aurantiacus]|uniref:Nitroimidazol reductase NimA, pyridoxamine 5'-phosphate oxidase superfamily n=1 Tax=Microlunatus aurantiacus TaxID=446786 RepID=A0ABP7EIN7_9ACTN